MKAVNLTLFICILVAVLANTYLVYGLTPKFHNFYLFYEHTSDLPLLTRGILQLTILWPIVAIPIVTGSTLYYLSNRRRPPRIRLYLILLAGLIILSILVAIGLFLPLWSMPGVTIMN